jgi:hypothetical protein
MSIVLLELEIIIQSNLVLFTNHKMLIKCSHLVLDIDRLYIAKVLIRFHTLELGNSVADTIVLFIIFLN